MEKPRLAWHVRGTWSAADDRLPFAVWLGILWVGILGGFGTDFPRFLHEKPAAPVVVSVHGVVFTVWMLLLTAQVLLVLRNRIAWHMRLGWVTVGWALLMAVVGPWAAIASLAVQIQAPDFAPQFLSLNIADLGGFFVLLAWGITLRKNPAAHKRIMILATVSLAQPGFNRLGAWFIPGEPSSAQMLFLLVYYGNLALVLLMAVWDWWKGRLMRQFVLGAAGLLAAEYLASLLYFWAPWRNLTAAWVAAWARHFG
jgi:hypothetical protein